MKNFKLYLTLGHDIRLMEEESYSSRGLVGRFGYRRMSVKEVDRWVAECWGPILGYIPVVYILCKGWFFFMFKTEEDVIHILSMVWIVKSGSLMLKRWHVAFNPEKELIRFRHLWVLMPSTRCLESGGL